MNRVLSLSLNDTMLIYPKINSLLVTGLETNGSQLVRLVEIPFWLVSFALSLAILASENFKALKHRMETKLNIASDDRTPKAN